METLLIYFCRHLQDILGGCKKPRHAIWHAQNVRHIHIAIDPKADSLACFLQDGGSNIWAKWAKPLLDSKRTRPGTIRASLTSLHKFLEFVIDQTENKVTTFPAIDADTIERCKLLLKRVIAMSSAVNHMYNHENWERVLDDQMNAVNPSDTSTMVDTPPAQKALALIITSAVSKLTKREALVVRDFLIARIVLENGQRPGPLETVRLRDFERLHEKDGRFVMFVSQHKTSRAGPAPLTITANLKTNIERYITNIRGILANEDEQAIFVTEQGTAFMPGTIGKRVTEWWRKATGKHISSTSLRKMHSSNLINEDDVNKRSAHRLMCHSTRTAEKHYMINRLAESAVQGHKVLAQNINLKDTCSTPLTTSKVESDDDQHPTRTSDLSSKQWDDVHLLFADVIKSNAPLTYTETRNLMSESMDLMEEVRNDVIVAKICNPVHGTPVCRTFHSRKPPAKRLSGSKIVRPTARGPVEDGGFGRNTMRTSLQNNLKSITHVLGNPRS